MDWAWLQSVAFSDILTISCNSKVESIYHALGCLCCRGCLSGYVPDGFCSYLAISYDGLGMYLGRALFVPCSQLKRIFLSDYRTTTEQGNSLAITKNRLTLAQMPKKIARRLPGDQYLKFIARFYGFTYTSTQAVELGLRGAVNTSTFL
jgi:hypothetical protein